MKRIILFSIFFLFLTTSSSNSGVVYTEEEIVDLRGVVHYVKVNNFSKKVSYFWDNDKWERPDEEWQKFLQRVYDHRRQFKKRYSRTRAREMKELKRLKRDLE